jgi:hypothetical protein
MEMTTVTGDNCQSKRVEKRVFDHCGGESGIRTHGTVSRTHAFQACALSHSAISPDGLSLQGRGNFCKGAWAGRMKFTQLIELSPKIVASVGASTSRFRTVEPKTGPPQRLRIATVQHAKRGMTIDRMLVFSIFMSVIAAGNARPAMAQTCTRQGLDVSCDDGRQGILSGDAHHLGRWHAVEPGVAAFKHHHRQQLIDDRRTGRIVPLDNPSAPDKARCPVLDGVSYSY